MSKIDDYMTELEKQLGEMRAAYAEGTLMQSRPYGIITRVKLPSQVFVRDFEAMLSEAKEIKDFDFVTSTAEFNLTKPEFFNMRMMGYANKLAWIMEELKLVEAEGDLRLNASDKIAVGHIETLHMQAQQDQLDWGQIMSRKGINHEQISELKNRASQQEAVRLPRSRQFIPINF